MGDDKKKASFITQVENRNNVEWRHIACGHWGSCGYVSFYRAVRRDFRCKHGVFVFAVGGNCIALLGTTVITLLGTTISQCSGQLYVACAIFVVLCKVEWMLRFFAPIFTLRPGAPFLVFGGPAGERCMARVLQVVYALSDTSLSPVFASISVNAVGIGIPEG